MAKAKRPKAKRTEKIRLGLNGVIRALMTAQKRAERSIKIGRKRVAESRGGPADVIKANRASLAGSRDAKRIVAAALRQLNAAPCLDQFMNCDPEYFRATTARRTR